MRALFSSGLRPYICQSCRRDAHIVRRKLSSKPSSIPEIYDVVCVGGGPAGLGLLAALSTTTPQLQGITLLGANQLIRGVARYLETKGGSH